MSKPLPSKEQTLFRQVVQGYENKQYKKALKTAEQILKKCPDHGATIAMKALIINSLGRTDEAFELAKVALKHSMQSHVCWHVYGLLYRAQKNYEEAIKAYKFALRLDPDSQQIQRDLALLQVQTRDYAGYVASRKAMLTTRPDFRQNWTALAIAHHLNGELQAAENILKTYEDTIKHTPSRHDLEHAGATIYKNLIIAETGDTERALEHLDSIYKHHPDRQAVMELKAEYLLRAGKSSEAETAYRKLLARNADCRAYYMGLEKALGLNREKAADHDKILELHEEYATKSERVDAPRRMPLDFLSGEAFRKTADAYLRRMLRKGVPSTFANVKALYEDEDKKHAIHDLVLGYESEAGANGTNGTSETKTDGTKPDLWKISVLYFLAQHYNYHLSRDLTKAMSYIDKCIDLNTQATEYSYHMIKARILKNQGDVAKAADAMNIARERDLKDRYINTKCAKYQLRADRNEDALQTLGLFTRKEAVGGPLGDLLDMQCMWFLYEDGCSYLRQNNLSLALKRFHAISDIFDVWTEDQFDFHSFSLRKGQITAYIEMIHWEDHLRSHPFYSRTALKAVEVYLRLADDPELATKHMHGNEGEDAKKKAKKARKDAEKAEDEKTLAAASKSSPAPPADGEQKKEDTDPHGFELLKTKDPLGMAAKFLTPVLDVAGEDVRVQIAGVEVFARQKKFLQALKCLLAAYRIEPGHPMVKGLKGVLEKQREKELKGTGNDEVEKVLTEGLASLKV